MLKHPGVCVRLVSTDMVRGPTDMVGALVAKKCARTRSSSAVHLGIKRRTIRVNNALDYLTGRMSKDFVDAARFRRRACTFSSRDVEHFNPYEFADYLSSIKASKRSSETFSTKMFPQNRAGGLNKVG